GDGALVDRAAVNRQLAGAVDRDGAAGVVEGDALNNAQRAAGQHLDGLAVGDGLGEELIAGAADVDGAVIVEDAVGELRRSDQVERADSAGDVVVEDGDGALLDRAAVTRQLAGAVDRDGAAGVVEGDALNNAQRAAGQHLDGLAVGDGLGEELIAGAADVDGAVIVEDAVGELRRSDQVERADSAGDVVVEDGDGALVDRAAVNRQLAGAVDRDGAAGVVEGDALNNAQRAAGQHLDGLAVGDGLGEELIAGAADVDGAVIVEDAVLQEVCALKIQRTVDGDSPAGNAARPAIVEIRAKRQRRTLVNDDLTGACICDIDEDIERATLQVNRPGV